MTSFQAKIGWERPRKREKKKSFGWVSTRPVIENSKNIQKIRKHLIASFQAKISWVRPIKRENKKNHSDEFLLDPKQKIPKKRKKFKNLKNNIMASFQANIGWERPRKREKN